MPRFPSKVAFASTHKYSPHGKTRPSKYSSEVVKALKRDGFIVHSGAQVEVLPQMCETATKLIRESSELSAVFPPGTLLVPVPRSSPRKEGAEYVWPARRICQEFRNQGVGTELSDLVRRTANVRKAATAEKGNRPSPEEHYATIEVGPLPLLPISAITLIDDVITRGSTIVGLTARLHEAFPDVPIYCFALVRTISPGEVTEMIDPVVGQVTYIGGQLARRP